MSSTAASPRRHRHRGGRLLGPVRGGRRHDHRPLLVLWLGYGQKEATGTSLAAIIVIGRLAVAAQAGYGNVDLWHGPPDRGARGGGRGGRHGAAAAALRARVWRRLRRAAAGLGRGADLLDGRRRPDRPAGARLRRREWRAVCWGWAAASCSSRRWWCSPRMSQLGARGDLAGGDRDGGSGGHLAPARLRQRAAARRHHHRGAVAARVLAGVVLANAFPERALELSFAGGPAPVRLATRGQGGTALGSAQMEILEVTTQDSGGQVTVSLKGELDLSTVGKVEEELKRVEEAGRGRRARSVAAHLPRLHRAAGRRHGRRAGPRGRPAPRGRARARRRSSGSSRSPGSRSASKWSTTARARPGPGSGGRAA